MYPLALAAAVLALDRWSKQAIAETMQLYSSQTIIPRFFDLVHTRNRGIAFSMFADSAPLVRDWILPLVSAAAVVLIVALFWRSGTVAGKTSYALALVLAGAAGNLYDRLLYGYVTDFLDVYVGSWHWPAFNVADSAITVGAGLLLLDSVRRSAPVEEPESA
jgi:signal peptidase II